MRILKNKFMIALLTLMIMATTLGIENVNAATVIGFFPTTAQIMQGESYSLSDIPGTWTTSNSNIVTVSSKGIIRGKNVGTATVTVKGSSYTCKCSVTVTKFNMNDQISRNIDSYRQYINDLVKYTNQYRTKNNVKKVSLDGPLMQVATHRSIEMARADVLSHTRPDGSKFYDLMKKYGIPYTYTGENIGSYQLDAKEVVDDWYKSSGHRKNMLNEKYTKIGVGVGVTSGGYYYWTQIFKN